MALVVVEVAATGALPCHSNGAGRHICAPGGRHIGHQVCMSMLMSRHVPIYMSICMPVHMSMHISVLIFVHMSMHMSIL